MILRCLSAPALSPTATRERSRPLALLRLRQCRPPARVARRPGAGIRHMRALLWLVDTLLDLYIWLLIAQAVLSCLLAVGVVNRHIRGVAVIGDFLYRLTEPALRQIR